LTCDLFVPKGILVRFEHGSLSGGAVRIRPPVSTDLGSRRYSVGYPVCKLPPVPFQRCAGGRRTGEHLDRQAISPDVITCDDWDGMVWRSNIVTVALPV